MSYLTGILCEIPRKFVCCAKGRWCLVSGNVCAGMLFVVVCCGKVCLASHFNLCNSGCLAWNDWRSVNEELGRVWMEVDMA
jgi:hypothetical protein